MPRKEDDYPVDPGSGLTIGPWGSAPGGPNTTDPTYGWGTGWPGGTQPGFPNPGMGGIPGTGSPSFGDTNPTYNPWGGGGNEFNQAFNSGGGGGSSSGMDRFLATFLPILGNLGQGYLANRAQGKSEEANRKDIQDRIRAALATLSPAHISMLSQAFLPQIMAQLNPQMQTAIQALNTSQGRRGLFQSPIGLAQESGLRGQLAQAGPQQAFQQAMGLAGQQASAITGAPFAFSQPNYNYGNAFYNAFKEGLAGYALAKNRREPEPPSPYNVIGDYQSGGRSYA